MRRAALVVIATLLLVSGCTGEQAAPPPNRTSATAAPTSCAEEVPRAPLPEWARAGFTPPDQKAPYVLGADGNILGVVFGDPLTAEQRPGKDNKVLWVSRLDVKGDPLRIEARLAGSDLTVDREVQNGPGPSVIDLPKAGCWSLSLSWSGHHDHLALLYH